MREKRECSVPYNGPEKRGLRLRDPDAFIRKIVSFYLTKTIINKKGGKHEYQN